MSRFPKFSLVLMLTFAIVGCAQGGNTPAPAEATLPATEEAAQLPTETSAAEGATEEATEEEITEEEATELPAATPMAEDEAIQLPVILPSPFDAEILKNLAYALEFVGDDPVQLEDGVYEDVDNRIHVSWIDTYALGDLNDQPAAAVVLVANTGGSGTFSYLAIVLEQEGEAVNITSTLLGDRIQLNWMTIANNEVQIDFVTQGPDDPLCCATQRTFATYALDGAEESTSLINTDITVIGVQPQLGETVIITFTPELAPATSAPGLCTENALGLGRADAWRCMTEDDLIYDPCFEMGDTGTVVCGTDPLMGEEGFVLELSEPLPEPDSGLISGLWLVQLGDGTICSLSTSGESIPTLDDDAIAPYGCADEAHSNLMSEIFDTGPVYYAQRVVLGLTEDGYVVKSSVRTPVATIWR